MLGREIKAYMEERGIKQKKIADDIGVSAATMNEICKGKRRVEATEYFDICKALGVSLDFFPERMKNKERATM